MKEIASGHLLELNLLDKSKPNIARGNSGILRIQITLRLPFKKRLFPVERPGGNKYAG